MWSRWIGPWMLEALHLGDNAVYLLDGRARWRRFRLWIAPIVCLALAGGSVLGGLALAPVLATNAEMAVVLRMVLGTTAVAIPGLGDGVAGWQAVMLFGVWSVLGLIGQAVAPGLGAVTIARDAERRALEPVLATPMTDRAIVLGKLAASSYPCFLAALSVLPAFGFCAAVAEIGPRLALFGMASMAVQVFSRSAVGVAFSTLVRRSVAAVVASYAMAFVGIPILQSVVILPLQLLFIHRMGLFTGSMPVSGFSGMMAATRDLTVAATAITAVLDVLIGVLAIGLARRQLSAIRHSGTN
ncbi:MAG TPA: hypothetical protein PLD23_00360 [Armatimonadota bacterium]|nr:hypothetical protein [Armatimonadota bacterium]HQK91922.1 hypothetical protein [Armatimonadota bacterium]